MSDYHKGYAEQADAMIADLLSQLAAVTAERDELKRAIESWKAEEQAWQDDMREVHAEADKMRALADAERLRGDMLDNAAAGFANERDAALARVAQLEGAVVFSKRLFDGMLNTMSTQSRWLEGILSQSPSEALASGHSARSQEYRKSISPEQEAAVRMAQLQLSTIVNRCHQTVAGDREIATEALKALADAFGEGERV